MGSDPWNVEKRALRLINQLIDREFCGVAIELPCVITPALFPLRKLVDDALEILFQGLDDDLDFAALGLRPRTKFFGWNDLAVARRGQCKPHWRAQNDNILCGRLFA